MDITQLILDDHHEQRRLFAMLEEVDPSDKATLSAIWGRLSTFLEVHAEAEEELFYPELLQLGEGAGGKDTPEAETQDAIEDHNEIRATVAEVGVVFFRAHFSPRHSVCSVSVFYNHAFVDWRSETRPAGAGFKFLVR